MSLRLGALWALRHLGLSKNLLVAYRDRDHEEEGEGKITPQGRVRSKVESLLVLLVQVPS